MNRAILRRTARLVASCRVVPGAEVTCPGEIAILTVRGDVDSAKVALLVRKVRQVAASRPRQLTLDLHDATLVNRLSQTVVAGCDHQLRGGGNRPGDFMVTLQGLQQ